MGYVDQPHHHQKLNRHAHDLLVMLLAAVLLALVAAIAAVLITILPGKKFRQQGSTGTKHVSHTTIQNWLLG